MLVVLTVVVVLILCLRTSKYVLVFLATFPTLLESCVVMTSSGSSVIKAEEAVLVVVVVDLVVVEVSGSTTDLTLLDTLMDVDVSVLLFLKLSVMAAFNLASLPWILDRLGILIPALDVGTLTKNLTF